METTVCKVYLIVNGLYVVVVQNQGCTTILNEFRSNNLWLISNFWSFLISFAGAVAHGFVVDFLQSVSDCYLERTCPEQFVLDLLQLRVPKLFAESKKPDTSLTTLQSPFVVREKFTTNLYEYIYNNNLKEKLQMQMTTIIVRSFLQLMYACIHDT